jgi:hypothetical protein
MGEVAQRGPLAGLELEMIGDHLKKGIKRRDAFKGSFAMLGALAVATGVGKGTSAASAVASLGLLRRICPRSSSPPPPPRSAPARPGSPTGWTSPSSSATSSASR